MKYKEYLIKTDDGYILQELPEHAGSGLIEVPEGAEILIEYESGHQEFFKNFFEDCYHEDGFWFCCYDMPRFYRSGNIIWQRPTQPKSLNDQYAEIEKVRQAVKIKSGSDSDHMADAMSYGLIGIKQDAVNHPPHYTNGKVECIDALESATVGKTGIEAVCVANVIKYLWRYEDKNGIEDVRKAQWYLNRLLSAMGD